MTEREILLQVFRNRGWLSPALVSALLEGPGFASSVWLPQLEQTGFLLRRRLRGGLLLFRARFRTGSERERRKRL